MITSLGIRPPKKIIRHGEYLRVPLTSRIRQLAYFSSFTEDEVEVLAKPHLEFLLQFPNEQQLLDYFNVYPRGEVLLVELCAAVGTCQSRAAFAQGGKPAHEQLLYYGCEPGSIDAGT